MKYSIISFSHLQDELKDIKIKEHISEEKIKYILYLHTPKYKTCKYINDRNFICPCDASKSKYYKHQF